MKALTERRELRGGCLELWKVIRLIPVVATVVFFAVENYFLRLRVQELQGFRAGIPATMLPTDRPNHHESPILYKGERMTVRRYPSSSSGTAANADYLVIINREGIVEAAFSTDREEGREWARRSSDRSK